MRTLQKRKKCLIVSVIFGSVYVVVTLAALILLVPLIADPIVRILSLIGISCSLITVLVVTVGGVIIYLQDRSIAKLTQELGNSLHHEARKEE